MTGGSGLFPELGMTLTYALPRRIAPRGALYGTSLLITGGNTGIGNALARQALQLGASVRFTCRTAEKVDATAAGLRADCPHSDVLGYQLDMGDQESVDRLADRVRRDGVVDTLILNAGVHVPFGFHTTIDGHELHHQVNFLSPARLFLSLSQGLRPVRRVLYVSSDAHRRGDLPATFPFSFWARYSRSKLLATTFFLAARPLFPSTTISVLSPGSVETDVDRHKHPIIRRLRGLNRTIQQPEEAASALLDGVFASADPELYRNRGEVVDPSPRCADPKLQMSVWDEVIGDLPDRAGGVAPTHVIRNHAETLTRLAPFVRTPRSEREVAEIVCRARRSGKTIRVVGSRHSYNDCFYSASELISLEQLNTIGPVDRSRGTITIGSGVTVQALCDHLDAIGYALKWAGNSGKQTVVGAAITGTHGYHREGGLIAELIVGARIVTGAGEALRVDDEAELRALRVSLGTLGIVTEVTMSLVPSGEPVKYELETLDEPEFLERLGSLGRDNEYFRFFPNRYHPKRFSVLTINPTEERPTADALQRLRYIDTTNAPRVLVATLRKVMRSAIMHRVLGRLPAPRLRMSLIAPYSTLLFVNAGIVNRWHWIAGLIYQTWNDDRTRNMELAIRPDDFARFLAVYRKAQSAFHAKTGEFSTYFTGRYAGASCRTLLGPNRGRDVIFVDLHVRRSPGAAAFLHDLEKQLMRLMPIRPHWGKEFTQDRRDLAGAYPAECWREFAAAKQRFDPQNIFSNGYTKRVFGW